jgi:hypothetical protein
LRSIQGKGTIAADTSHGLPGQTGEFVPGATGMGPTRPSPYFHAGLNPPAAAQAPIAVPKAPSDTIKKPEQKP